MEKDKLREKVKKDVESFLKSGGIIRVIPIGVGAYDDEDELTEKQKAIKRLHGMTQHKKPSDYLSAKNRPRTLSFEGIT